MTDGELLFNFDTSAAPVAAVSRPRVTGGHWKDRANLRRGRPIGTAKGRRGGTDGANFVQLGQRRQHQDRSAAVYPDARTTEERVSRPAKRQRVEKPSGQLSEGSRTGRPTYASSGQEVVSSLFTFNPKSTRVPSDEQGEQVSDALPSNAPLPEGAANFVNLGLSGSVATHLLTKLDLKAPTAIQQAAVPQLINEEADAFIQAETGSGKTLAYLLPIVQRLLSLSAPAIRSQQSNGQMHRDSGLFAIIIAPTRELCRQIQAVLDALLRGCAHWLVAGSVTGGERKKSEKARLRKGLNILVATPGRLVDHLQNTNVLDVSQVKWLVLDEGDRLMELGFEQDIKAVLDALEKRESRRPRIAPVPNGNGSSTLPQRRVTVLCSATMKMNVQKLGEVSLKDAVFLQSSREDKKLDSDTAEAKFTAPAQMKQSYIVVPAKQRLVTMAALLRKEFSRRGSVMKAIVFLSCADSVDFMFEVLRRGADNQTDNISKVTTASEPQQTASPPPSPEYSSSKSKPRSSTSETKLLGPITSSKAPLLASVTNENVSLFRLHGSLAQAVRTSTLKAFSKCTDPSILLCTDVASRGLDLPSIDLVIEYDPAFSAEDHLHRVGRTARAGKDGRAILFLNPGPEEGYIELLEKEGHSQEGQKRKLGRLEVDDTLKRGFVGNEVAMAKARAAQEPQPQESKRGGGNKATNFIPFAGSGNKDWEQRATDWQLDAERWALASENPKAHEMAEKAFKSSVAAYATHVKAERHMFDVAQLHLGHLAKAFALRDKPSSFGRGPASKKRSKSGAATGGGVQGTGRGGADSDNDVSRKSNAAGAGTANADDDIMAKMRKLARAREADQAGEFNFG